MDRMDRADRRRLKPPHKLEYIGDDVYVDMTLGEPIYWVMVETISMFERGIPLWKVDSWLDNVPDEVGDTVSFYPFHVDAEEVWELLILRQETSAETEERESRYAVTASTREAAPALPPPPKTLSIR
jgi:hypothetical protein